MRLAREYFLLSKVSRRGYRSKQSAANVRGVAIKKPDSCSNPLLKKKISQSKCYPLQCSPLPYPYTAPCEFSTVGSSAAGHLVLSCSRVASLLLSLHPRTQTWFL